MKSNQLPAETMVDILHLSSSQTGNTGEAERREEKMLEEEKETVWFLKMRLNQIVERLKPIRSALFFAIDPLVGCH